ncbi:hypothetical protein MDA_GLEAN10023685 [Myotis davidii]|uniref:Uncharacterized protein n=1 Tax=Myotis davidii TaxID=225400 RepID=L5LQH3_MYODS|nr:hypothetical protein MDA_GLEAN10023685 [Myotis davidii]
MANGKSGVNGGGCRQRQVKARAPPVTPHTEGDPQWEQGHKRAGPANLSVPRPAAVRFRLPNGKLGTGVGGSRGQGWLLGAGDDGPNHRIGLETVPPHDFRAPGR